MTEIGADTLHVVTHPKGWAVRRRASSRALRVFATQDAAVEHATATADGRTVYVHRPNGMVDRTIQP